jgi:hypothetical protein
MKLKKKSIKKEKEKNELIGLTCQTRNLGHKTRTTQ